LIENNEKYTPPSIPIVERSDKVYQPPQTDLKPQTNYNFNNSNYNNSNITILTE
jgi:hypothetical protein